MALVMYMGEIGQILDSFEDFIGEELKSSVHTFKMLVFQVLYCSLKPGEAFMAYSLRRDIESIKSKTELDTSTND